jgi:cobalt-zinc-cadmium efflux system outer membrane protein
VNTSIRRPARLAVAGLWLCAGASLAAEPDPPGADLASVQAWLQAHSPALQAREFDAQAADARAQAAGALPDPMFEVELEGIDFERPRALPGQVETTTWRVRQQFPLWGKRALEREVAGFEASAAGYRRDGERLEQMEQAGMEWLRWWHARASATVLARQLETLARMREVAVARYASGSGEQQDAIRADVELTAMRREAIELASDEQAATARLNASLGRAPTAPLAAPAEDPQLAPRGDLADLLGGLRERHPMLQAEAAMASARAGMAEEVRRERWPDVAVGLGLMQMGNRAESWELMFEVEIPLQQGARRQRERAAELRAQAADARLQAAVDALAGRAAQAHARWQAAADQERLIERELIPQAQAGLESALAGYQAGAVDFDTLLTALEQTQQAQRERLAMRRMRLEAALELMLLQGELP